MDGVTIIEGDSETLVPPPAIPENVNKLGAGDALLAATVAHHVFGAMSLPESVKKATSFAIKIIGMQNCNAGQGHAIEKALITLDHLATRDPMTGLNNRRSGEQIISNAHVNALSTNSRYSVLMVDIDHFKKVNDTYGHDVGDEAIKIVAGVLSNAVRGGDIACRWGGEEFLCILNGADKSTAISVAERIRTSVELAVVPVAGKVTVSIGVATCCTATQDVAQIVKAADQGLYEAKQNGRNRVMSTIAEA